MAKQYQQVLSNKLKFEPKSKKRERVQIKLKWDANDADYRYVSDTWDADALFDNEKLLYILAYISLPRDFKGKTDDPRFGHYIPDNEDIEELCEILSEYELAAYDEYGMCHSCDKVEITYYDGNGVEFAVTFDGIIEEFKKMSYEEIYKKINSMELPDW